MFPLANTGTDTFSLCMVCVSVRMALCVCVYVKTTETKNQGQKGLFINAFHSFYRLYNERASLYFYFFYCSPRPHNLAKYNQLSIIIIIHTKRL